MQIYRSTGKHVSEELETDFQVYTDQTPNLPQLEKVLPQRNQRKVVVLSGVTSGLGRALLPHFAQDWMIIGCGRSEIEIDHLKDQFGPSHYFKVVDVANAEAVTEWGQEVKHSIEEEGVDLLLNNASIMNKSAVTWETPAAEFTQIMQINVCGVQHMLAAFIPRMAKQGCIINVSSSWGREADAMVGAYCASKFAVEGLTQATALELSQREETKQMTIVTLDPGGGIATPMLSICALPEYVTAAPTPEAWAEIAYPFIVNIHHEQHGRALTCPSVFTNHNVQKT